MQTLLSLVVVFATKSAMACAKAAEDMQVPMCRWLVCYLGLADLRQSEANLSQVWVSWCIGSTRLRTDSSDCQTSWLRWTPRSRSCHISRVRALRASAAASSPAWRVPVYMHVSWLTLLPSNWYTCDRTASDSESEGQHRVRGMPCREACINLMLQLWGEVPWASWKAREYSMVSSSSVSC